ncbi:MAG: hypothetical protein JSS35_07610, partial [Proteobacteria bacterium]|nr:hypothetical protein [Pseudomonadota bacterium]
GRALEQAQAAALAQVDSAKAAFDTAWDDLRRNRARDLPIARRTAEAATRSRTAGETDRADELAAQAAQVDAELALGDARLAAALATVDLEDALRRAFDPAETATFAAELNKAKAPPRPAAEVGGAR